MQTPAEAFPVSEATAAAADVVGSKPVPESFKPLGGGMKPSPSAPSLFRMLEDMNLARENMALNVKPMLLLGVPMFFFAVCASAFLEYYAVSTAAHFAIFVVGSYVVFSSYFVADFYMGRVSQSYKAIPDDKKFYVLSNVLKSAVLLAYSPLAARTLYQALVQDVWSTPRIRNLGVLYAIPDAVSMLLVERMAWSTKVHHVCVVVFMVVNLCVSYEEETVGRALVVYAVFSTFAYLVNMLLASRFLPVAPTVRLLMSILALGIYGACLGVNWCWQVAFLWRMFLERPTPSLFVYVGLISLVVADDCILLVWLWRNVGRTAKAAAALAQEQKGQQKEE
jgi:hypothetical protein